MKKKRTRQHIYEEASQAILRERLPATWVLHEYKPDYGLDYGVEIFDEVPIESRSAVEVYETLGEMFFVQLKAVGSVTPKRVTLIDRLNVEKFPLTPIRRSATIDVIAYPLETALLQTVQSMGAAQPVLLLLVSIEDRRVFFLCLNDYIEKVLVPAKPDYALQKTCTLRIPLTNEITSDPDTLEPVRFYGQRSKLYAAFSKFHYQMDVFDHTDDLAHIRHFMSIATRYDFWSNTPLWRSVAWTHHNLLAFEQLLDEHPPALETEGGPFEETSLLHHRAWAMWRQLANLNNIYEEQCREWYLPTALAEWSAGRLPGPESDDSV
jgi:hypothetical protein